MRAGRVAAGPVEGTATVAVVGTTLDGLVTAGEAPLVDAAEEAVRGSCTGCHAMSTSHRVRLVDLRGPGWWGRFSGGRLWGQFK